MKILYLVDPLPNYVSDPLYIGLNRILGSDCVIDFPPKAILHNRQDKVWYLPQVKSHQYTTLDIVDFLRSKIFDLVVVASPRAESIEALRRLYSRATFPPIVFIDSADEINMCFDVAAQFPIAVYFKRELLTGMSPGARVYALTRQFHLQTKLRAKTYPLQISVVVDELPTASEAKKDLDVSFYGHISHPKRAKALATLESLTAEGIKVAGGVYGSATDRNYKFEFNPVRRLLTKLLDRSTTSIEVQQRKLSVPAYYDVLRKSKIAVSIRGGGFDTFRYWEIPACGTFLLSERPDIDIPHDFEDHRQAVFCRPDLKDLKHLVRYFVEHDAEREAIAAAGREHLLKHHSCERRAQYFLDICAKAA